MTGSAKKGASETAPSKANKDGSSTKAAAKMEERPLRPAQCRAYMRRTLAREFRGIVDGFIEGAKSGSCQHVKLVTELMQGSPKVRARGKSTVQQLLDEFDREDR